ncbi:hypothetical protein LIER_29220 [Lithospermum erythrorhizon]|uniref:Uncharacterized protein n=1 Tax=Lithospermum erythrorhizon TaxID=34254 RepID=A0AAV3RIF8_LITER
MVEINPTLPLFFNMHNTSHFGPLTSFPTAQSCKKFADHKPNKVTEGRWHTKWCFLKEGMSNAVPERWTSLGEALRPKFEKTALIRAQIKTLKQLFDKPLHYKVFCEEGVLIQVGLIRDKEFDQTVAPPVSWGIASYISVYYRVFSFSDLTIALPWEKGLPPPKRGLHYSEKTKTLIARKLPTSKILDFTEDPPSSNIPKKEPLEGTSGLHTASSNSLPDVSLDSAPKAKARYSANYLDLPCTLPGGFQNTEDSTLWKKSNAFRTARPLLLERIGRDYASIKDPLKVQGAPTRHLIKAMNASYEIARRADLVDDASEEACEKERALQKHDTLQARFTRLEGEHFDLSQKLEQLQSVHNITTKKVGELEQKVKSAEEGLP